MNQKPQNQASQGTSQQRVVMDVLGQYGVPADAMKTEGESTIVIAPGAGLSEYQQLIRSADWFPGEADALSDEFEGRFVVGLERLPLHKQAKITEWLSYPRDEREKAYEAVCGTATKPVAMALDSLKNPGKYAAKLASKPTAADRTKRVLAAFLDDEE